MNHDNRNRVQVDLAGNWRLWTNTIPQGSTPLGTVTRRPGDTGALVRIERTGLYLQINAGAARSLIARKIEAAMGGMNEEKTGVG